MHCDDTYYSRIFQVILFVIESSDLTVRIPTHIDLRPKWNSIGVSYTLYNTGLRLMHSERRYPFGILCIPANTPWPMCSVNANVYWARAIKLGSVIIPYRRTVGTIFLVQITMYRTSSLVYTSTGSILVCHGLTRNCDALLWQRPSVIESTHTFHLII